MLSEEVNRSTGIFTLSCHSLLGYPQNSNTPPPPILRPLSPLTLHISLSSAAAFSTPSATTIAALHRKLRKRLPPLVDLVDAAVRALHQPGGGGLWLAGERAEGALGWDWGIRWLTVLGGRYLFSCIVLSELSTMHRYDFDSSGVICIVCLLLWLLAMDELHLGKQISPSHLHRTLIPRPGLVSRLKIS